MNTIKHLLKKNNLRITPQRIAIYDYLYSNKFHPTAEEIYNEIKLLFPNISFATIYKTLDTFLKNNIINLILIDNNNKRFDANTSNHSHLYCNTCNTLLDNNIMIDLNKYVDNIYKNNKFIAKENNLIFYGKCENCI